MKPFQYERDPLKVKFYASSRWKRCAASYARSKAWICEQCFNRNIDINRPIYGQLQVHHKTPITLANIDNPDIAVNHDNLELLCITCHNKERAAEKPVCQEGYRFEKGRLVKIED